MRRSTQELLHQLKRTDDIQKYFNDNKDEILKETTEGYLTGLLQIKGRKVSDIAALSGQGDYVYKVFQGKRKASRDILLAISIGMKMTTQETQFLLRIAQTAQLDPRNRRDSVIIYALNHALSIEITNDILFDVKETTL